MLRAREVLPGMKAQNEGQIVFVSSVAGLRKFARCSVYGASKWAVQGIAGSLREECRGTGVKVATVCPGSVATPWWLERERGGKDEAPSEEQMLQMLSPSDVAKATMTVVEQVLARVLSVSRSAAGARALSIRQSLRAHTHTHTLAHTHTNAHTHTHTLTHSHAHTHFLRARDRTLRT